MKIDFNTRKYELGEDIKKYVEKKIKKLEKKLPRKVRDTVHAKVLLSENSQKNKDRFSCEVRIHLPNQEIVVEEATINMFAAVDIVESKLRNQISKYHSIHSNHRVDRKGVLNKLRGIADKDFRGKQN